MTLSPTSSRGATAVTREIGYDQVTTAVTVSSTTEATGTSVIAGSSYTFPGTAVLAIFSCPYMIAPPAAGAAMTVCLFEGSTEITRLCAITTQSTSAIDIPAPYAVYRFTPTAGAHTYSVTGFTSTGNGIVGAGVAGTAAYRPCYLRLVMAT